MGYGVDWQYYIKMWVITYPIVVCEGVHNKSLFGTSLNKIDNLSIEPLRFLVEQPMP